MPGKGIQVKTKGCNGRLQFMGKVVDEIMLEMKELQRFLAVYKNYGNPQEDRRNQNRQDKNDEPGVIIHKLVGIKIVFPHHRLESGQCLHIPINVKKERDGQGQGRTNQDQDRMQEPFEFFHILILSIPEPKSIGVILARAFVKVL
jgi:hypothetical protein